MDLNRPSKSRRIKCEGSLCEAPPRPAYRAIPAPSLTAPSVYQPAGALKTDVNTKRKPCRQDVFSVYTPSLFSRSPSPQLDSLSRRRMTGASKFSQNHTGPRVPLM